MASHWFRISYAENAFKRVLAARGFTLGTLTIADGVDAMIEFYEHYRAQHADLAADGDVLEVRIGSALELRRTMIRDDGTQPQKSLVLSFGTGSGDRVTQISSPEQLASVRAHLREEPLMKAQLPVHLRME